MPSLKKVKVSICIPVYNSEKYLRKCFDSVINQTLKEIEIIIINDASPDNSDKIIREYQKKDKRIVYLKNKTNQGISHSRLNSINQSRGEYIGFVDSDDWVDAKMFEKLYSCAKNEKSDLVICDFYYILGQHQKHWKRYDCTSWKKKYQDKELKDLDMIMYNVKEGFYHIGRSLCNGLWKSDLLENDKNFLTKITYGEDFYTISKVFFSNPGIKISVVPEPLYYYLASVKDYDFINDPTYQYIDLYELFKEKENFKAIEYFSKKIFREKNLQLGWILFSPNSKSKSGGYYQGIKQLHKIYNFKTRGKILIKLVEISQIESILFLTKIPLLMVSILLDFRYTIKKILEIANSLYLQKFIYKFKKN